MKKHKRNSSVYSIAIGAMMSALAIIIMEIGVLLEIADLTSAMVASLLIWFLQIEFSTSVSISSFFVISVLSFVLLPSKLPCFYFVLLYGWYPIFKYQFKNRTLKKQVKITLKCIAWAVATVLQEILARNLLGYVQNRYVTATIIILVFITYFLYDIFLTKVAIIYYYKWRKHLFKN